MYQNRSNVGQSIFQNDIPTQNVNPNDVMMQNMMKMFQTQMISMMQSHSSGFDLEKFYMHKVNDMNQFYNQVKPEECQLQQTSQFINAYNPNKYYEEIYSNTNRQLNFDDIPVSNDYNLQKNEYFNQYQNKQVQKTNGSQKQFKRDSYSQFEEDSNSFKQSYHHFDSEENNRHQSRQLSNSNFNQNQSNYQDKMNSQYSNLRNQNDENNYQKNLNRINNNNEEIRYRKNSNPYDEMPIKPIQQNQFEEIQIRNKQLDDISNKIKIENNRKQSDIQLEPQNQNCQWQEQPTKKLQNQIQFDEIPIKPAKQNLFDEIPIKPAKQNLFDEIPVKSSKQNSFDEIPIKPAKQNAFDEMPIRSAQNYSFDEIPIKSNQQNSFDEQKIRHTKQKNQQEDRSKQNLSIKQSNNIAEDDQTKSFQNQNPEDTFIKTTKNQNYDLVQERNPIQKQQVDNYEQNDEAQIRKKPFLKKGTRQFLSNAQQRSDIAKKEHAEIMKENNAIVNKMPQNQNLQGKAFKPQNSQKFEKQEQREVQNKTKRSETPKEVPKPKPQIQQQKIQKQKESQKQTEIQNSLRPSNNDYQFDNYEDQTSQNLKTSSSYFGLKKEMKEKIVDQTNLSDSEDEMTRNQFQQQISTLNLEIAKYKNENDKLKQAQGKYDDLIKQFQKEKDEWEKQKENEKLFLEEWKEEEKKKILREKRVFERQAKSNQNIPNRKEREEIEQLKQQIQKLQDEQKQKDQKNKLAYERVKKQYEEVNQKNQELQAEVKALELRLFEQKKPSQLSQSQQSKSQKIQIKQSQSSPISKKEIIQQKLKTQSPQSIPEDQQLQKKINERKSQYLDDEEYDDDNEYQQNDEEENEDEYNDNDQENQSDELSENYEDIMEKSMTQKSKIQIGNQQKQKKYDLVSMQEENIPFTIKNINNLISEQEFSFDQNRFYLMYKRNKDMPSKIVNQNVGPDGKVSRQYANGKKEVVFHNGVKREVFPEGYVIVHFTNKDVKQTLPNGTIIYFFADAHTTQITVANGPNIYRFSNQQIEIHFPDGKKEIRFGDGTEKYISINGEEQTFFSDGIIQKIDSKKIKQIEYPNGNIDTIYPDGQKLRQSKK
ncbi:unnamed protein product [Paramecium sonneborni]|uniref:Centromere protein J C-terminal domain-containing protein n=1 Tax=Paramecium sonneborni TaxID=65129 RepID=A0A8S1L8Z2_9CILI|nr:unnamed protein product [Paramecium sonneborni]